MTPRRHRSAAARPAPGPSRSTRRSTARRDAPAASPRVDRQRSGSRHCDAAGVLTWGREQWRGVRTAAIAPIVTAQPSRRLGDGVRQLWRRLVDAVSWTPPTSTEIGTVAKSGLAAGLAWAVAQAVTGAPDPVLAPLTALVVVQVSVRASILTALQRSAAVVLGVLLAVAVGDALGAQRHHRRRARRRVARRRPAGAAAAACRGEAGAGQPPGRALGRRVDQGSQAGRRALDTLLGAAVGVAVSLVLPASRLVDARQTLDRLADGLEGVLETMGSGLQQPWSTDQTEDWRRTARTVRDRLVDQAAEAVGNGREAARWNVRDRRHIDALGRYEDVMPRLERTAIGVSVISRGLDDHARLAGTTHRAMPAMGALLVALASAVRALVDDVLGESADADLARALAEVRTRRDRCMQGAFRRARLALEHGEAQTATAGGRVARLRRLARASRPDRRRPERFPAQLTTPNRRPPGHRAARARRTRPSTAAANRSVRRGTRRP